MRDYNIVFSSLKSGTHLFSYKLEQSFFDLFDYQEIENAQFNVDVSFQKTNTMLELDFTLKGDYTAYCDITDEPFQLQVNNQFHLVVKFGESFKDGDEILILRFETYEINIAQHLFELAVLSIPTKKVHPDVLAGKKGKEMLKYMTNEEGNKDEETIDPRWDKLKDLLNK